MPNAVCRILYSLVLKVVQDGLFDARKAIDWPLPYSTPTPGPDPRTETADCSLCNCNTIEITNTIRILIEFHLWFQKPWKTPRKSHSGSLVEAKEAVDKFARPTRPRMRKTPENSEILVEIRVFSKYFKLKNQ